MKLWFILYALFLSPTMTSSSHTIKTVWSTIETFLDLPSTIAVSGTCRALHDEIIDHDTQKVKVSHFIVEAYSDKHPWARIPLYLPCALNVIHFPSVRQMRLAFPSICKSLRSINAVDIEVDFEDVTASCLTYQWRWMLIICIWDMMRSSTAAKGIYLRAWDL